MKANDDKELTAKQKKTLLLGIGLDTDDDQKRISVGRNFVLAGGSKPTHELMQEKAIKFNEELDRRGKRLEEIGPDEFCDIADRVKMHEKS